MDIVISHESALEYWRWYFYLHGNEKNTDFTKQRRKNTPISAPNRATILDVAPSELSYPINMIVGSQNAKRKSEIVHTRVYTGPTPDGCFTNIGNGLAVSTPPFCFFQMAVELPLVKLIELGLELCGTYSLPALSGQNNEHSNGQSNEHSNKKEIAGDGLRGNREEIAGDGLRGNKKETAGKGLPGHEEWIPDEIIHGDKELVIDRSLYNRWKEDVDKTLYGNGEETADDNLYGHPPLTNVKALKNLAGRMEGVNGQKNANRALRYIADGSGSPMETILFMLLTLPHQLGGYGLPAPVLNKRIDMAKAGISRSGKPYYVLDLFWPKAKLAIEYDSDSYHTGADRIARDAKKRSDLKARGITVITVTSGQVRSATEFERIAKLISRNLHGRLRFKNPGQFLKARRELRNLLL
ncbi:MAG: endonuclease domain-containing protein [Clostridiales bacterium]|nr:endonuclease domain-containing protein [Clostridiales bacterium]